MTKNKQAGELKAEASASVSRFPAPGNNIILMFTDTIAYRFLLNQEIR